MLRRKSADQSQIEQIPPLVHDVLRSPGQPLDVDTRAFMERGFERDFSQVRLHTDAKAAQSALALNARAYAAGRDIVFGAGEYAPGLMAGRRLIAHELAHVAQQSSAAASTSTLEIGTASDPMEREADAVADVLTSQRAGAVDGGAKAVRGSLATPRLQRSILRDVGDVLAAPFVALYRLFGGEHYRQETLKEYLAGLKQRGAIENNYDSDNKARACVKREGELGPYDNGIKTLLIREMLKGATLGGDESSIIALLRRQAPADREQIVGAIGRDAILGDFSGKNRRIVEAIMLTAADAQGTALITRLRNMPEGELQDYVGNAIDADVKAAAQRAAMLQKITAPVPADAAVSPAGVASFQINGIDVQAEPDSQSTDEKLRNRAVTRFGLVMDKAPSAILVDTATNNVNSFTPPHLLAMVRTLFGPGYDPTNTSGYGRGTTSDDKAAGRTSLRFHESSHGQDWFDFLAANAPPVFAGQVGMSWPDFQKAHAQFEIDIKKYNELASQYSLKMTDCPGTPATEEQLQPFGLTAAICHER